MNITKKAKPRREIFRTKNMNTYKYGVKKS